MARDPSRPISDRARLFAVEYLKDLNATQAAIRAGYPAKNANVLGPRIRRLPHVAAVIEAELEARLEAERVTAHRVVTELAKIGFANIADFLRVQPDGSAVVDLGGATRDHFAALSEVQVDEYMDGRGEDAREVRRIKVKLADKRAALVDLGRHLGAFKERVELTGKDGGPVEIETIRRVIVDPRNPDA